MEPKDIPFPKYARDYFAQLRAQYELLLDERKMSPPAPIADLFQRVDQNPDKTSWADVFALETAYLNAVPPECLKAEILKLRERYRDVAGADAYNQYLSSALSDLTNAKEPEMRAEIFALAQRIRYLYTFVPPKESIRNRLAMHGAFWTLGAVLIGVVVFVLYGLVGHTPVPAILIVVFAGILGGFVSVQQRLQGSTGAVDPLFKELELSAGWFSIAVVSPLSGGIFAAVLYLLFASGLLSGGLFPALGPSKPCETLAASKTMPSPAPSPNPSPGITFAEFIDQSSPRSPMEYGKLLVWAFIAGFAERMVPDALTRLTGQFSVGGGAPPRGAPKAPTPAPSGAPEVVAAAAVPAKEDGDVDKPPEKPG